MWDLMGDASERRFVLNNEAEKGPRKTKGCIDLGSADVIPALHRTSKVPSSSKDPHNL